MFYVFVFVTCKNVTLRNMTSNLRGSDNDTENKIEVYTNAIQYIDSNMKRPEINWNKILKKHTKDRKC